MASVSVSELILFIAALTVALGVSTTLMSNVQDISQSLGAKGDGVTEQIETDVEIISDSGSPSAIYDDGSGNITVLVKNTGQKTLAADGTGLDVLVDGEYQIIANATVVGAPDAHAWRSGEVLRVTVTRSLDTGSHRIAVHANGDTATIRFRTD
jgi:flagellar protein FlaG